MATSTRPQRAVRPVKKPYSEYVDVEVNAAQHDTAKARNADSSRKRKAHSLDSYDLGLSESEYELDNEEEATDTDSDQASTPAKDTRGRSSRPGGFNKPRKTALSAAAEPRGRVSVARPLSAAARERLVEQARAKKNAGTRNSYATYWNVFQRYLESGGYEQDAEPIDHDISEPTAEVVGAFASFLEWYAQGRPGDRSNGRKGGRKAADGKLASLVGVHAAIQDGVKVACEKAGVPVYKLIEQSDYKLVYDVYCTKSVARSDSNNSDVHLSMTADDLLKMCHELLGKGDTNSIRDLALTLYQFSTVSRGDDVRPRTLDELMVRYLKSVGPSKCPSIAVMQPPGGGKTLGKRPAWKAFIRNRMPECCPVRALFAWLSCQFLLQSTPMPMPDAGPFLLFPGRAAGEPMSLNNHARIILDVFALISIDPPKVTHEFRVFAAQALHDMGVTLEVIQRIGHWLLDSFGTAYIVPGFTPEALLALGFWPGAAQKDFTGYWAERFHVSVPSDLVYLLMPGLDRLEAAAAKLAEAAQRSGSSVDRATRNKAQRMAQVLKMGAVVVVQDALELAEKFPDNPIHKLLLEQPSFRQLLSTYKHFKSMGGFEKQRPLSVRQRIEQLDEKLDQLFMGQVIRGQTPRRNWQYTPQLQQPQRSDSDSWELSSLLEQLQGVAEGKLNAPEPLQQRVRAMAEQLQQDIAAHADQLPYDDWDDAEQDAEGDGEPAEEQHSQSMDTCGMDKQRGDAAEGGAGSDVAVAPRHKEQQQLGNVVAAAAADQQQDPSDVAGQPKQQQAPSDVAGQPKQQQAPSDVAGQPKQQQPSNAAAGQQQQAPSDAARPAGVSLQAGVGAEKGGPDPAMPAAGGTPLRQQEPAFGGDNANGSSPGGFHVTPSGQQYTGQQLQGRHAGTTTPGGHYTAFFNMHNASRAVHQQQPRQHQQLQGAYSSADGQLQEEMQSLVWEAEEVVLQIQQAQQDLAHLTACTSAGDQDAELLAEMQQLMEMRRADLQTLQQRRQRIDLKMMRLRSVQARQSAGHAGNARSSAAFVPGAGSRMLGAGLLQQMGGSIDPVNDIFNPYTAQRGISLSAHEPAMPSTGLPGGTVPAAAVVEALQDMGRHIISEVRASQGKTTWQAPSTAAAAAAGNHTGSSSRQSSKGVAAAAAAGAADSAMAPRGKQHSKSSSSEPMAFPNFGKLSVVDAARWYHVTPLANHLTALEGGDCKEWTPQKLQAQGRDAWRGGARGPRYQRWAEWLQLMRYLAARQWELHNQQGSIPSVLDAAAVVDTERGELSLTQFYKQVVVEWAAAQAGEEQQERDADGGNGSVGEDGGGGDTS